MSEKQRKCSICAGDMLPWDNHQACLKCRNDKKGKDKCVIGKESDCTICAGALKIPHRKKSSKTKVSDKFDDSLLDEPTPSKSSTSSTSTPDSSLQEMLKAMNYVHPPGGWIYYFCFFRRPMSGVRCPASDVRRHAWFPLI